jgi:hypothetical protein
MMLKRGFVICFLLPFVLLLPGCLLFIHGDFESRPLVLILPTEAELADLPLDKLLSFRSQQQGPRILVNSPQPGESYVPPVPIDIRFEPRDQAKVDLASLKVVYVKLFKIDITERISPYVKEDGIQVAQADLPVGNHKLILSIADENGRSSSQMIQLQIKESL